MAPPVELVGLTQKPDTLTGTAPGVSVTVDLADGVENYIVWAWNIFTPTGTATLIPQQENTPGVWGAIPGTSSLVLIAQAAAAQVIPISPTVANVRVRVDIAGGWEGSVSAVIVETVLP